MTRDLLLPIVFLLIVSCSIDRDKKVDRNKFLYKTGDDTELFFKNMRASNYDKEEMKETRWEIYKHEDMYARADSFDINVAIILNVLNDEAYIMVEAGQGFLGKDPVTVYTISDSASIADTIRLDLPNKEGMLEFATEIYEAIQEKKEIITISEKDTISVLAKQSKREAYRITMSDYYRLVRIF